MFGRGMRENRCMTDFLDLASLEGTLTASAAWQAHFADLGTFATGISFSRDPEAFAGNGADIASITVNGIEIEAAEFAPTDIRFSALFPDGRSIIGGETFLEETGAGGTLHRLRVSETTREARSAINALLVFATMKAIADAVADRTWDELRQAGGIETPTGKLTQFE